jgi:hypothetical protein
MPVRLSPDENQPSVAVEIPLARPLPDYDLDQLEQPTPRDVDAILVSQGFRDLVDDTRGVLMDLLSNSSLEITQLTGAICPGDDAVYRPGLWIVLRDTHATPKQSLPPATQERVASIAAQLVTRLQLA